MIERYQIINLIEKDELKAVYLARDTTLQRDVVFIKFKKRAESVDFETFSSYAGKLCALQHPNLLTVYDIHEDKDGYCMLTQFLESESLEHRLKQGSLSQVGVYSMASDLLDALHAVHSLELYHGALRTDSVRRLPKVMGGHRYMIVDFGLERISTMITGGSVFMADPLLMAPELMKGDREPDSKSDLFSLGQLCYVVLIGGHPYADKTIEELVDIYEKEEFPHLRHYVPEAQGDFVEWIMWLISLERERRPASVKEAMEKLHKINLIDPAPNIFGLTQALPITEVYRKNISLVGYSPKSRNLSELEVKENKKEFFFSFFRSKNKICFLAALAALMFVALGCIGVFMHDGEIGDISLFQKVAKKLKKDPDVHLGELKLLNQSAIDQGFANVDIQDGIIEDWRVIMGLPSFEKKKEKEKTDMIRRIVRVGNFKEFISSEQMPYYNFKNSEIHPKRVVTNRFKGNAQLEDGWNILLKTPAKTDLALEVCLELIIKNCEYDIKVIDPEDKVFKFHVDDPESGLLNVPILVDHVKKGYYVIEVKIASAPTMKKGFEAGVSAVWCKFLSKGK